ncbi:C4-dicarboxylate TRAP transporter substrate-binding protein [Chelatococcus sp. GCM10030263]|uniref:C4-dicarboxylate TRAP transporter substrate-binding protein n=1 Tax=Chelatococcus sp. GCM10030263 TaxID=3273387 RepID=UPI00361FD109
MKLGKVSGRPLLRRTVLSAGLLSALALGMTATTASAQEYKIRLGHPLTTSDAAHKAMVYLADNIKKATNGRVEVTVYPADQLGKQKDLGEMVRQGANVIQLTDALFLGDVEPDAAILQAPYLMDNPEDFRKILGSDWLNDLDKRLQAKGIRVISWNNYFGTRQILANRPIHKPADLKGLNFRAAAAPMYVEMVKAFGARPITTGFAEVYTGLSQKVIDLLEAPLPTMYASKFYEQAKYVTLTSHMIGWDPVIMSETYFKSLPPDIQKIILDEANKAADYMSKLKKEEETQMIELYKKAGVTVITDVDRQAFKDATKVVYDNYPGWTPGLPDKVRALLDR